MKIFHFKFFIYLNKHLSQGINEIKKEIGQYRYKVSGFESDDIGGMPMREFYSAIRSLKQQSTGQHA
jgi:hypothetical protein